MIQSIQNMLFSHNGIKLKINGRKISGKSPNYMETIDTLPNSLWVKEEMKREIRKHFKLMKICGTQLKQVPEANVLH